MLICHRLEELAALGQTLHLALGVFDGVHRGHQAVISRAVEAAAKHGGLAGILTFDPHPIRVLAPAKAPSSLLATLEHKAALTGSLGAGLFVPLRFDLGFAAMEARDFIGKLCAAPVKTIAVGEDWRFGHRRGGDVAFLQREAALRGFRLEAVPPVMLDGERISSTRIRQAIRDGNLVAAARMLGRPYSISGTVRTGARLGRKLGFPTANLDPADSQLPPDGVWAVRVETGSNQTNPGVANLGTRPTVDGTGRILEVHLLDFEGDLYGKTIDVRFIKHLRAEQKFESVDALRERIAVDVAAARVVLQSNAANESLDAGFGS